MEMGHIEMPGQIINALDLTIPKAIECAALVTSLDFYTLKQSLKLASGNELVVFDVEVERPQNPVHDIRYSESIAVEFDKSDNRAPWVYALRKDFPPVSHLNLREFELPKCLCLYDIPYDEIKLHWKGRDFLERIREWLKLTASGKLHQADQPLEPLIISSGGVLILPDGVIKGTEFTLIKLNEENGQIFLQAKHRTDNYQTGDPYALMVLVGEVQEHGIIRKAPKNFQDLQEILLKANIDFYSKLKVWLGNKPFEQKYLKHKLILLLVLPKKGNNDEKIEYDYHAVITEDNFWNLGKKLGLRSKNKSHNISKAPDLLDCNLKVLIPHIEFNPDLAGILNGSVKASDKNIALIGAGALGSQTYNNLLRGGISNWNIIDHDILFPHNLARHGLGTLHVGLNKAKALAAFGNELLNTNLIKAQAENFLHPVNSQALTQSLQNSDLIIDISASIPVARELANMHEVKARRTSAFLNPEGSDLIILAEDEERKLSLDVLEMQYYRYLLYSSGLQEHLKMGEAGIRYANSCRSVSSRISQDFLAIHSGIASRMIKKFLETAEPYAGIWSIEPESVEVIKHELPLYDIKSHVINGWNIVIDEFLLDKIQEARTNKLSKETGGILIGSYDIIRRKIYLVDTILSPKDSEEYPYAYIRGIEGVKERLLEIERITANNLEYVGEWHSHPEQCSLNPSEADKILFSWLTDHMKILSRPPLMVVAGDNNNLNFLVENIPSENFNL